MLTPEAKKFLWALALVFAPAVVFGLFDGYIRTVRVEQTVVSMQHQVDRIEQLLDNKVSFAENTKGYGQ